MAFRVTPSLAHPLLPSCFFNITSAFSKHVLPRALYTPTFWPCPFPPKAARAKISIACSPKQAGSSNPAMKPTQPSRFLFPPPANIRELQNVIERSVIVCETANFSVDESWLSQQPLEKTTGSQLYLSEKVATQEKEIIEAALRESRGRVFGPSVPPRS